MAQKIIQLSPNSLNLFLDCPHCFWLDKNLGIKRPPQYPYSLNVAMDNLLQEEFDAYRKREATPALIKQSGVKARLFGNQKLLNQWRSNLAGIRYADVDLKATLLGAPDDMLEFEGGKLASLDYKSTASKTEKIFDRFQLQLDVYTFLLEKNGYQTPQKGYIAFYLVDTARGFVDRLPFRKELLEIKTNPEDVYDIFKDAVACLREASPPKHSKDCAYAKWLEKAGGFAKRAA